MLSFINLSIFVHLGKTNQQVKLRWSKVSLELLIYQSIEVSLLTVKIAHTHTVKHLYRVMLKHLWLLWHIDLYSFSDCPLNMACQDLRCRDPCQGNICGTNALCKGEIKEEKTSQTKLIHLSLGIVKNHFSMCQCPTGFRGDPFVLCHKGKSSTWSFLHLLSWHFLNSIAWKE